MGLFDFFRAISKEKKSTQNQNIKITSTSIDDLTNERTSKSSYADSCTISPDERAYYQPDDYYTYYSYPETEMAVQVVLFEQRKKISYPSMRGLYVAEILLLEYCRQLKYPKPSAGYPGFWWFEYGIRDIGHALESLEQRGFLRWASPKNSISGLKVEELKQILRNFDLPVTGKRSDLIERILSNIPEEKLIIPNYIPKYELTELGMAELEENGYVPYMHSHKYLTTEGNQFGDSFSVWDINKLFPNGNASDWRRIVGEIEKKRFGVNMANTVENGLAESKNTQKNCLGQSEEMREFLVGKKFEIDERINTLGDGFDEECRGMNYKAKGQDKDALIEFFVAIGKKFDAPALYRETAILLRKYGLYEEELLVIDAGLKNIAENSSHREKLLERRDRVVLLIEKKNSIMH